MNKINIVLGVLSFSLSLGAMAEADNEAKTITAICSDIKGAETHYFSKNNGDKSEENKFHDIVDSGISNKEFILVWTMGTDEATVGLRDIKSKDIGTAGIAFPIQIHSEQLTFVGTWDGAPLMTTIYPKQSIAILSQQSTQFPIIGEGIRAFMFHAKCNIDLS